MPMALNLWLVALTTSVVECILDDGESACH